MLLICTALACGAPPASIERPSTDALVDEAGGARIVFLPRATDGRLWLSLWIDAGARDADPPQLATVAAWTAATAPIEARVLADGIELARPCARSQLEACVRSLADALRARAPSEAALAGALARLAAARRRAAADDRRADALALAALLGESADPLGAAEDDARIDARRVAAFLEDHAGAGRVLLVAIGDAELGAIRRAVASAELPRARARRAERSEARHAVHVAVGDEDIVAAATLRPSLGDAAALAERLVARIEADLPRGRASADAFPLRGGAALLARVAGGGEEGARVLLDHLAEVAESPALEPVELPPPQDGPRALARWIGARWVARQEPALRGGIGVGAVVAGGRGDRVGAEDPDAELRAAARRALDEALRAAATPRVHGIDAEGGDSAVAGATVRARRLPGAARLSAIVLFEGGASEDPPNSHGLTALLAQVASDGCARVAERELGHTLA
ncbi:MAG TPA: hypothetical protein VIL20_03770, partial [Sandaracinaceae bacterium]